MFDTHCHLNFKVFQDNVGEVINNAAELGVLGIIVPGVDLESSRRAVEIAQAYKNIFAAVGIHPHHAQKNPEYLSELERLISHPKVVAVGEIGLDYYTYQKTKYKNYKIDAEFVKIQKELLKSQIDLAVLHKKTIIFHNREASEDMLQFVPKKTKVVFHCCEPEDRLLEFAAKHNVFIGVDGDVTYRQDKQEFVKKIPLDLLVLETDSPFLLPEPLKSRKIYPNKPQNISLIAKFVAELKGTKVGEIAKMTVTNSQKLFNLSHP